MERLLYATFGDSLIALMMEAVSTSETSVNFYDTTWRHIPDDSRLEEKAQ
jgi:hypothetical protein